MIRRPRKSTHCISSAASDVYKRQLLESEKKNKKNFLYYEGNSQRYTFLQYNFQMQNKLVPQVIRFIIIIIIVFFFLFNYQVINYKYLLQKCKYFVIILSLALKFHYLQIVQQHNFG
eukprot:TRINITY_DN10071_c0_g1_i1.p4 TRINITY_DN10071_c0_g1~~TRINITY_DN10071_c0_g1_i1.p4  ORF type:complete len:117 (+),score=19.58 TRINITY_DN10071_c0_g1_i1:126-476(+)